MTFTGYIYKITGSCGNVYIGSTMDYHTRKLAHNSKSKKSNKTCSKNLKKPLQFEVIRTDQYKLLKTMYLVEQYYIDMYKCVNRNRAYINDFIRKRQKRERRRNNKDTINKKQREKYQNDEERRNHRKIWYEANKKSIHTKREDNKDDINKKAREAYQKNKEKLKVHCPYCNLRVLKNNMKPHQKTKRCQKAQATKQININITINL